MPNEVVTELKGTDRDLQRVLKRGEREVKRTADSMDRTMTRLGTRIAAVFAADRLIRFGRAARSLSLEAEDAGSKFDTVFGPAVDKANGFVEEFANKAGFAKFELKDLLGTTGNVLQGLGATEDQSADLAIQMAKLAGDVASFNGATKDTPLVLRALQSALTGEREALKTYGIVLTQADVDQRALANSSKASAKELTALEKATATVQLAYERAAKAAGDLDRTLDSGSNKAAQRAAKFKDLGVAIGDVLGRAIERTTPAIDDMIYELELAKPAVEDLADAIEDSFDRMTGAIADNEDGLTSWSRKTVEALALVEIAYKRSFFNIGVVVDNLGKDLGATIGILNELITEGPGAANAMAKQLEKQGFNRGIGEGTNPVFDGFFDDLDKRIKELSSARRGLDNLRDRDRSRNRDRGGRDGGSGGGRDGRDGGVGRDGRTSASESRGSVAGMEGLEELNRRIQNSAARKPELEAMKKIEDAVRAGADKVAAAIEGGDDKMPEPSLTDVNMSGGFPRPGGLPPVIESAEATGRGPGMSRRQELAAINKVIDNYLAGEDARVPNAFGPATSHNPFGPDPVIMPGAMDNAALNQRLDRGNSWEELNEREERRMKSLDATLDRYQRQRDALPKGLSQKIDLVDQQIAEKEGELFAQLRTTKGAHESRTAEQFTDPATANELATLMKTQVAETKKSNSQLKKVEKAASSAGALR